MSLTVLTQGGGTGGETACIFVTGLSEGDVVTAAKDGKVITAEWNSAESRFEIAKIKDYGLWTVTATNGEKTKTQDVLVDAAMEFEIEMDYRLWLYREGDECEDVTGGWKATISGRQNGNFTKNAASITVTGTSGDMAISTQRIIPVTEYTSLNFKLVSGKASSIYPQVVAWIIFSQSSTSQIEEGTTIQVATPNSYPVVKTYDIAAYAPSDAYIFFNVYQGNITFSEIWLE